MGIVNLWQEARGNVLRKKWEMLKRGIDAADFPAKWACLCYIKTRSESLDRLYARSSSADQKRIYKRVAKESLRFSKSGDWPSACGLHIMMLNIESRYLPGSDAACVKVETDALIQEANAISDPGSLGGTDIAANDDRVAGHANLEARGSIPVQTLQERRPRATGLNIDQDARDRALQVGARARW